MLPPWRGGADKVTTLASNGGVVAGLAAENIQLTVLGKSLPSVSLYLVGYKFSSGYTSTGDITNVFLQAHLGSFSMNDVINGVADALNFGRINIDFLPTFTDVTATICTGRATNKADENLDTQFAGNPDHQGAEKWPSAGSGAVPMGSTFTLGSKTLDFTEKIGDGVWLNANLDIASGNSDIAKISRHLICFLPELIVGSCDTTWAVTVFVPRSGDFNAVQSCAARTAPSLLCGYWL